ncbi:MAG: 50S ribosomal protein L15 [Gemmatimonadetes bacterium]|nr:50S ribosomal protein L15 [Gemmatimonadota bacterium]
MPELHDLSPSPGSKRKKKRVGRGQGSGKGKRAGRGQDGQGSRSGGGVPAWFEGGQMPLQRRIPKRGFKNFNRVEYQPVNLRDLDRIEGGIVTPEILKAHGLIRSLKKPVKVLGAGDVDGAYEISAHGFSATARSKIEAAGGTVTILGGSVATEADATGEPAAEAAVDVVESEETPDPSGDEASAAEDEKA